MHQQQSALENIVGKGEIARYEQFLLFQQCFLLDQIVASPFVHIVDIVSFFFFAAELEEPKIGISGKVLNRAYVQSVAVYQKYLTRMGELIIFEPWLENYHFFQLSYIFFDIRQQYVRISIYLSTFNLMSLITSNSDNT